MSNWTQPSRKLCGVCHWPLANGQADDVFLGLLVTLTETYCNKYRVALVPAKTKLLGYANPKQQHLLEIAKLSNPIKINGQPVKFASEAEHVGVTRNVSGNIPHIMNRIAAYKTAMGSVLSAGLGTRATLLLDYESTNCMQLKDISPGWLHWYLPSLRPPS